ncbi:hypothetical protein GCWU000342_01177 [Shuttleworthella satelles DSM 14600]|uniref:Uncharacterized protein n=1 Tax=Shuttleworthella satelles DSM 14600 TaxID=626523 RepID=C4GB76_9FIRM|nr:hypothetical protein GCWU000342_01177 [Shuttleworthia satelles DSM 14600]
MRSKIRRIVSIDHPIRYHHRPIRSGRHLYKITASLQTCKEAVKILSYPAKYLKK